MGFRGSLRVFNVGIDVALVHDVTCGLGLNKCDLPN